MRFRALLLLLFHSTFSQKIPPPPDCLYLEGRSSWPLTHSQNAAFYPVDISLKAWESPFVLEGTARSVSDLREDGTYGITFDLHKIAKGDPNSGLLRRRKQLRLQFSLSPNSVAKGSGKNSSKLGFNKTNEIVRVPRCSPPPDGSLRTGKKYFLFVSRAQNHFIPLFSPEPLNKRNTKLVQGVLCKNCVGAPKVVGPKEVVLVPNERLRVRCRVSSGNPLPTLKWYKDGRLINFADTRFRLRAKRRQSIIVIRKARESDVGFYKCEGSVRGLGSDSITTRVHLRKLHSNSTSISNSTANSSKKTETTPTTLWAIKSSNCPAPYDSYCLNGGTCSFYDSINEYVCQCAEGYKGQRCADKQINTGSMYLSYFCIYGNNPHYPCS